ncbi:MAG TPA: adenylate/guanylate cyclase domain-containing protein, partial [Nevskiaceae bacterium]|nr:adenylate/guanylate cyclase domain-containing protein [Nevskiaceae bacterium]
MPSQQPVRRLAAIVFTDIVGYSRLVHRDDANALKLVGEHFALVRELAREHGGRVIKTIGDSVHLEFASAQAATGCAIAIQQRHAQRNARVAEGQRFDIRIGVHLGDVELRDGDTYGDGVNIAARLQPLAPVGGIAISDHVRGQLREELRHQFVARGVQELKNIDTPVEVFVIEAPAIAEIPVEAAPPPLRVSSPRRMPSTWVIVSLAFVGLGLFISRPWEHGPKADRRVDAAASADKSIAVLPLANSTGDPANEYFSDGISEELISSLSRLSHLKVIGRTSSFQFRNTTDSSAAIGQKLGVSYLLEGSVRKSSDRVRIAIALVNSADGSNVWSDSYDREMKDIFAVQSEIAAAVATQLQVALFGNNAQAAQAPSAATPSNQNVEA